MKSDQINGMILVMSRWAVVFAVVVAQSLCAQTPVNFKMAFIGDQGLGTNARAVLNLIKSEGAQVVLHQGDFDYQDNPAAWDAQINDILGADFPYFATVGNHDMVKWSGSDGYQQYLKNRLNRLGITWDGDLGVKSSLRYKGIFIILVAPGTLGSGHDAYVRDRLAADNSIWRICSWHKNMRAMQVGDKTDETGWEVYEEARKGGAIIATAHEHSYSRTHLLSNMMKQTVASRADTLVLTKGKSFVFVSGAGGASIRVQKRSGAWWACTYTATQKANYGALFGTFNVNGIPNLATFYFKDIDGKIADRFVVRSEVERATRVEEPGQKLPSQFSLEQNYPNPFPRAAKTPTVGGGNPSTTIRFRLVKTAPVKLTIIDLLGRPVRALFVGEMNAGEQRVHWDGCDDNGFRVPSGTYVYRLESGGEVQTRKLMLVQ
ncbi:MAG: T9SS type A sorting domain-containing protein [candidate division KSB1 bacterium]|nr:T9SS type A sorting domain-containing protein [candidate division KSB1 bacterium]MDZ7300885.1 T9SS type A sorting domain-containing protein [candidate division KSB1 bacterium]MDZ7309845.1 T9SS type A sorting domain-containing protein [candidate division KSB1 bacterium]